MTDLFHRPVPDVAWTALRSPTLPPAKFTNCAVFGGSCFAIVDAGALEAEERQRVINLVQSRQARGDQLKALLLTHHHPDHIGAMNFLRNHFQVPLYAHPDCEARVDFEVDHYVHEGDCIDLGENNRINVHETPGHAQGHVIYVHEASSWCYAGDLVIGRGSVLIDERDGGCVVRYLESLRTTMKRCESSTASPEIKVLLPGHGQPIMNTIERIEQLISHRQYRERQLLDLLAAKPHNIDEVLATIYADKPDKILPFARATIHSHMRKLVGESRIQAAGTQRWELSSSAALASREH